jgi:hypothetical protein
MIVAQGGSTTLLTNGQVLVAGGCCNSSGQQLTTAELYNRATGAWTLTGSLNDARQGASATLLQNGQVLVAGGQIGDPFSGTFPLASAELYDPTTGKFTLTGSMNTPREGASATLLQNGQVLVAGGCCDNVTGTITATAELYNPSTGTWTFTGNFNTARSGPFMTRLQNGQVLAAGGGQNRPQPCCSGSPLLTSAELYNPSSGTWSTTGSMNLPHAGGELVLLTNGQALVAGGQANTASLTTTAELYNPATATWTFTGNLSIERNLFTATLLQNGQVLAAGGMTTNSVLLSSAELFNPPTGVWTLTGSMNFARDNSVAPLLTNGQVLEPGGGGSSSTISELYSP